MRRSGKMESSAHGTLTLVRESKIDQLVDGGPEARLEASGVCVRDGYFWVIFDNSPHIGRLHPSLAPGHPEHRLLRQRGESAGFEDIAVQQATSRVLIIREAVRRKGGHFFPMIEEYDEDFRYLTSRWVDFPLDRANKGMEGLTTTRTDGEELALCLCEGNFCLGGKEGRRPGGGRIHSFRPGNEWVHVAEIALPASVRFVDYASLDLVEGRMAVVSQVSSSLWVGRFDAASSTFDGDGTTYDFPRRDGKILYGNIEGVAWLSPSRLVVVSDRAKPRQPSACREKDQSIHVFDLPP